MRGNFWKFATIVLASFLLIVLGVFIGNEFNENKSKNGEDIWSSLPFFKPKETQLEGEVFIVTKGGNNYKLGLVPIIITQVNKKGKKIISQTKTNGDGKFTLTLPRGEYEVQAVSSRYVIDDTEIYNWFVPIVLNQEKQSIILSNDNLSSVP